MGKKASLKIDLGYDKHEIYDEYFSDENHHEDDDDIDYRYFKSENYRDRLRGENSLSKQRRGKPKRIQQRHQHCSTKSINLQNSFKSRIHLYHKPPISADIKPFSWISDDIFIYIIAFLDIRSISAIGCANSVSNKVLSDIALYFGDEKYSVFLLPCMKRSKIRAEHIDQFLLWDAMEKKLSPIGIAIDLSLFETVKQRDQTFPLFHTVTISSLNTPSHFHMRYRQRHLLKSTLSQCGRWCSYLSEKCELTSFKIMSSFTMEEKQNTIKRRVQRIPFCNSVIASYMTPDLCAILSVPSQGLRRYILTILPTVNSIRRNLKLCQKDILMKSSTSLSSFQATTTSPSVKIDKLNRFVVTAFTTHFCVFSVSDDTDCSLLWEMSKVQGQKGSCGFWCSWIIYDHYIIVLTRKKVMIYDIFMKLLVACGVLPITSRGPLIDGRTHCDSRKAELVVFADRIWIACNNGTALCTGMIFKRLARRRCHQHQEGKQPLLEVKKFHYILTTKCFSSAPSLKCTEKLLYVADGNSLKIFHFDDVMKENFNTYRVLYTKWRIEHFQPDLTKVICCITDGKKQKIEVINLLFLRSTVTASKLSHKTHYHPSIFVKNSVTFCSRYKLDFIQIQCNNRLLVSYYDGGGKSELKIFSIR